MELTKWVGASQYAHENPQVVVNLLPELGVGVDLRRHGKRLW
jgi:hypothetical protein